MCQNDYLSGVSSPHKYLFCVSCQVTETTDYREEADTPIRGYTESGVWFMTPDGTSHLNLAEFALLMDSASEKQTFSLAERM